MVNMSPGLKDVVAQRANAAGKNMSEWVRDLVVSATGYDVAGDQNFDTRGRPRVYANDKERAKARYAAEKVRNEKRNAVMTALMRQERLEGVDALEKWLLERGISLD